MRRIALPAVLALGVSLASADEAEDPIGPKIEELLGRLDANTPVERDIAERELIGLGPEALGPLASIPQEDQTAEQRRRILRVLATLSRQSAERRVRGTKITMNWREQRLMHLLEDIREQSGIELLDLRREVNQPSDPIELAFDRDEYLFGRLIDEVCRQASLRRHWSYEEGKLGLILGPPPGPFVDYRGAVRVELLMLTTVADLRIERPAQLRIETALDFEPTLRPIQVVVKAEDLTAKTDRGDELAWAGSPVSYYTPEAAGTPIRAALRLEAPPRSATRIARLEGKLGVLIPAINDEVAFRRAVSLESTRRDSIAGSVELVRFHEEDEGIWNARLVLGMDVDAAPSHLRGGLEPDVFLRDSEGNPFAQNGGMSAQGLGEGRTLYEFLFVDAPGEIGDYDLVVRAPGRVIDVEVPFAFDEVPLP